MILNANKKKPKDHHLRQTGLVKLSVGNAIKKVTYFSTALQNMTTNLIRSKITHTTRVRITLLNLQPKLLNLLDQPHIMSHTKG